MTLPDISVILPLFDGARFVAEALQSVVGQEVPLLEIIVVDDGSTDDGPQIASRFPGVRLLRQEHLGVGAARATGVAAARGDLLAFIDQDDLWRPGRLTVALERMRQDPRLDFVVGHQHLFLEAGIERPAWLPERDLAPSRPGWVVGTLLAHRRCFERVGSFEATLASGADDVDWFARARDAGLRWEMVEPVLLDHRIHDANLSHGEANYRRDMLRTLRGTIARKRAADRAAPSGRVSVVVPVFDGASYLSAALESIVAQGEGVREVLVVDDGSTDESGQIARDFGAPVRCIRQPNAGIGAARNRGVRECRGDFLAFLDSDDLWPAGSLDSRLELLDARPELDLVFGQMEQFISPDVPPEHAARLRVPGGWTSGLFAGTMLVRRRAWDRVGAFDPSLRSGEFIDWFDRARQLGLKRGETANPVLRRRVHQANHGIVRKAAAIDYARVAHAAIRRRRGSAG